MRKIARTYMKICDFYLISKISMCAKFCEPIDVSIICIEGHEMFHPFVVGRMSLKIGNICLSIVLLQLILKHELAGSVICGWMNL